MALLLKSGGVFLHIPKTGGSWVNDVLWKLGLVKCEFGEKHSDMNRILHFYAYHPYEYTRKCLRLGFKWHQEVIKGYKFCFVRHPLQWYESYWQYKACRWHLDPGYYKWHPIATTYDVGSDEFDSFVINLVDKFPGYVTELYNHYAVPEKIDFIGRQENLVEDLIHVLHNLNENFDEERIRNWPRINTSLSLKGKPIWNSQLKELVEKVEYAGLINYGYAQKPQPILTATA